jgi:putative DNA primase/helicase
LVMIQASTFPISKVLREDPKELFRAAADAEKMTGYVMGLGQEKEMAVKLPSLPATEKTYIHVAYKEKDEAKRLGARWDKSERSWYVPKGADLSEFEKWRKPSNIELSPVQQFKDALRNAGLIVDEPKMDGKFHRVPVLGEAKGKSGSYKAYLDGHPAGYIENFKTGLKLNWKADGVYHSHENVAALSEENLTKRRLREKELEKQYEIKSSEVSKKLAGYKLSNDHPYLVVKSHLSHEHLQDEKGNLVVPIHDMAGKVWGLQKITETGEKFFEKDCNITGHFHLLGKFNPEHKTYIAEGLATALSIQKAVGIDANVVVAFVANNLPHVAKSIANHQKGSQIIVCGDDDHKTERSLGRNPGREKALEAATMVGGLAIFPKFGESEKSKGLTDFNDLEVSRGLAVVKSLLLEDSRDRRIER